MPGDATLLRASRANRTSRGLGSEQLACCHGLFFLGKGPTKRPRLGCGCFLNLSFFFLQEDAKKFEDYLQASLGFDVAWMQLVCVPT